MIDIIAVTYNQLPYLRQSLFNLKRNAGIPCNVVVVSDGATDGTNEWLLSEEAKPFYDKLIIKENGGVSSAFNCGIVNCDSDLIVTHACDLIHPEQWLSRLLKCWQTNKFDFIAMGVRYAIPLDISKDSPFYPYSQMPCKFDWQFPKGFNPKKCRRVTSDILILPDRPAGNVEMIGYRKTYQKVGLYTEFGGYGHNDAEFLLRCSGKRLRFGIFGDYVLHLNQSDPVISARKKAEAQINKGRLKSGKFKIPSYEECVKKYGDLGKQVLPKEK